MADFRFGDIPIRVAPFPLERNVPNRPHKRRRNQTAAYHARIQKKWLKRFGSHKERYAIFMNPRAVGLMGSPGFVLDPRDVAKLKGLL